MNKKVFMRSFGILTMSAMPLAAILSCGKTGSIERYDTKNDGELIIKSAFTIDGNQDKALKWSIAQYNQLPKVKNKSDGWMPIKIISINGGYGKAASQLQTDIATKKTENMPNLLIDYPDSLGIVASYKFELDFLKTSTKVNKDLIDQNFLANNKEIGGVDSKGIYLVPLGKSSEMISINKPLFQKVIKDFKSAGAKLDNNNSDEITGLIQNINSKSNDLSKWVADSKINYSKYAINDQIFSNYDKLLEFSNKTAKLYNLDPKEKKFVLGVDTGAVNFLYTYYFAKNQNYKDFLFSKDTKTGFLNYKLFQEGSNQNEGFKDFIQKLITHIQSGALKIGGGGEYPSTSLKEHEAIFTIGSTAGYDYNYWDASKIKIFPTKTSKTFRTSDFKEIKYFEATSTSKAGWYTAGRYKNALVSKKDEVKNYEVLVTPKALKSLNEIDDKKDNRIIFIHDKPEIFNDNKVAKLDENVLFSNQNIIFSKGNESKTNIFVVKSSDVQSSDGKDTLQKNELEVKSAPWTRDDAVDKQKRIVMNQGPSFVGVYANKQENAATAKFLNWFYDPNSEFTENNVTKSNIQWFGEKSGYVVVPKNFDKDLKDFKNSGTQIAFDSFTNPNKLIFENPIDRYSAKLRKVVLSSTLKSIYTKFHTGDTTNANSMYEELRSLAKTNKVIE